MTGLLDCRAELACILAVNDVMAMGAIAACRDRGIRLPADLTMAGFDDIAKLRDVGSRESWWCASRLRLGSDPRPRRWLIFIALWTRD